MTTRKPEHPKNSKFAPSAFYRVSIYPFFYDEGCRATLPSIEDGERYSGFAIASCRRRTCILTHSPGSSSDIARMLRQRRICKGEQIFQFVLAVCSPQPVKVA
jgi:hypothetical protein